MGLVDGSTKKIIVASNFTIHVRITSPDSSFLLVAFVVVRRETPTRVLSRSCGDLQDVLTAFASKLGLWQVDFFSLAEARPGAAGTCRATPLCDRTRHTTR
jgi:hypothetical protein